jgi:hypothetical protein
LFLCLFHAPRQNRPYAVLKKLHSRRNFGVIPTMLLVVVPIIRNIGAKAGLIFADGGKQRPSLHLWSRA